LRERYPQLESGRTFSELALCARSALCTRAQELPRARSMRSHETDGVRWLIGSSFNPIIGRRNQTRFDASLRAPVPAKNVVGQLSLPKLHPPLVEGIDPPDHAPGRRPTGARKRQPRQPLSRGRARNQIVVEGPVAAATRTAAPLAMVSRRGPPASLHSLGPRPRPHRGPASAPWSGQGHVAEPAFP